jgi:hypothetical protein
LKRPLHPIANRLPRSVVNLAKYQIGRLLAWNLDALGVLWATDKARGQHGYTPLYARHLRRGRRSIHSVLEIGIGYGSDPKRGGNSLYMWKNYFPRAAVYGLDIFDKRLVGVPGVVALKGDQSDTVALRKLVEGRAPFDLVIDDGSHIASDVIASFGVLFPAVRPGGWYVIEDLETAYIEERYGGGPPGTPHTAVALTKSLLDDVNVGPRAISSVHAYRGIVFIRKGDSLGV